jgi:hypothetical protein
MFRWGRDEGDSWSGSMVLEEEAWPVMQINANVSSAFQQALQTGDTASSPLSGVTLYLALVQNQVMTTSVAVHIL